ncbi:hypothetical protein ACNJX9_03130 [Bradyrhizobium sp. DASA03076]|uniref:Uncharacterized protein n=1 Tax=Bradyrhizobium manausense TaxID=989370 RepID=A0A0R3E235_9BRAD|nr:hypothetical protein [Bradyrhizobium manausense]KRQ13285.1 hypothetical protein AOQ71_15175 [Bradyrhizobium manausense]
MRFWIASAFAKASADKSLRSQRRGDIDPRLTIPLCGKHERQSCARDALLLAALSRMRHDRDKSNNQAAIQSKAIKGGCFQ